MAKLEQEFKLRLTAAELSRLKKIGKPGKIYRQVNHYFDVLPALPFAKSGVGIRIREQNGKFLLTVKLPARGKKGLHVKEEWESALAARTARAYIGGKKKLSACRARPVRALKRKCGKLPLEEIVCLGSIHNLRTERKVDGLKLELDCSTMFGKRYYEAECETESSARDGKTLKALWRRLKIPFRHEATSKLGRFLEKLRRH